MDTEDVEGKGSPHLTTEQAAFTPSNTGTLVSISGRGLVVHVAHRTKQEVFDLK